MHLGLLTFKCVQAIDYVYFASKTVFFQSTYMLLFVTFYKVYRSIWPSNAYSKYYGILLTKSNDFKGIQKYSNNA